MEVRLAGHNLDHDLLMEIRAVLKAAADIPDGAETDTVRTRAREIVDSDNWTPETLSAAYARISRDPRPVTELRKIARNTVDRARRSNEQIIFGLGHASVAEHAVFNLDILGLSRLATEEVERMRLCSYTEKSQRYILLDEDFVVPSEIVESGLEDRFRSLVQQQNAFYRDAYELLRPWVFEQHPELAATEKNHRMLEGLAKEDARYGLSLATTVQLGETINARNAESLIGRTAAHPLAELREFSKRVHEAIAGTAPSVVKYTDPPEQLLYTPPALREMASTISDGETSAPSDDVVLLDIAEDAEIKVVAALLHSFGDADARSCRQRAREIGPERRLEVVRTSLRHIGPHDSVLREFEHAYAHYELVVSAACFGQLKRHRMATLTTQDYDVRLGVTVPPSFEGAGLVGRFETIRRDAEAFYETVRDSAGSHVAPYVLLNAHGRRVLWTINVRELYHICRLRLDPHAQWDIRRLSCRIVELARERIPGLLLMACGKDRFDDLRSQEFGS